MNNKYGSEKNSLLHLAAQKGVVDAILKEEIDIDILNNKGHSPIYLAAEKGHLHVVKLLLEKEQTIHLFCTQQSSQII